MRSRPTSFLPSFVPHPQPDSQDLPLHLSISLLSPVLRFPTT